MTNNLAGKRALVTAAANGIGRASAIALAANGASVVATDIDADGLDTLAGDVPGVETRVLDVLDPDAIAALAAAVGAIDILFNCAGVVHNGTILDSSEEEWDFAFDLNVKSHYRLIKALLPAMLAAGGASIINMSSLASSQKGVPQRFVYGTSKAAVIGMTKAIAADFVTRGIRCNAICPGTVATPSLEARLHATGDYEAARQQFIARQPMGRLGTAEEIAALVVYLASDEAAYTTGQALNIDGGWSI